MASDGGIFTFGNAGFYGSMGGTHLNAPVVGMAATATGNGYYEVASDGGVFTFGTAKFYGSMGGTHLNAPVVGMAATSPTTPGHGYWLVASTGGVFSFGAAQFHGSLGSTPRHAAVVGMIQAGSGYDLITVAGGAFSFTGVSRSTPGVFVDDIVGGSTTVTGDGFWLYGADGGVFSYGTAVYHTSLPGEHITPYKPVVGAATS